MFPGASSDGNWRRHGRQKESEEEEGNWRSRNVMWWMILRHNIHVFIIWKNVDLSCDSVRHFSGSPLFSFYMHLLIAHTVNNNVFFSKQVLMSNLCWRPTKYCFSCFFFQKRVHRVDSTPHVIELKVFLFSRDHAWNSLDRKKETLLLIYFWYSYFFVKLLFLLLLPY